VNHFRLLVVLALLSSSVIAFADDGGCGQNRSVRKQFGPYPLSEQLHREFAGKVDYAVGSDGTFESEVFTYLGAIQLGTRQWHVAYLELVSGISCRGTRRLLVFDDGLHYVGQYSHFNETPIRIAGSAVVFRNEVDGRKDVLVDFGTSGPPTSIFIEGDGPYERYYR